MTDPIQLIHDLDADAIRERIGAIDHERRALMVLLRAALAHPRHPVNTSTVNPTPKKRKAKAVRA